MKALIYSVLASTLLVSCGTSVGLVQYVPARVNLGSGSVVQVSSRGHYPLARELSTATTRALADGGYYRATETGSMPWGGQPAIVWDVDKGYTDDDGYSSIRVHVNVYDSSRSIVYSDSYSESVKVSRSLAERERDRERDKKHNRWSSSSYRDYDNSYDYRWMADRMAKDVVRCLTPRKETYYETVDTDQKKNPLLLQAARMLASGNADAAEALARQARQTVPGDPENEYLLGLVERSRKNYAASNAHFQAAHNMAPDSKYADGIRKNSELQGNEAAYRAQMGR